MLKKIIAALALWIVFFDSAAQGIKDPLTETGIRSLTVGDSVPDLPLAKILTRQGVESAALSDFGDRLLILDFWFTSCISCIANMPKLDSLQRQYGNRLAVLLSTYEKEEDIRKFWQKNRLVKDLELPTVVEDSVLGKYFVHKYFPHVVWIYKGRVVAITDTDYINETNINHVLADKPVEWPVKHELLSYDYDQPLLSFNETYHYPGSLLKYSAIMGYRDGISPKVGIAVDTLNGTKRGYIINLPVVNAYFYLWIKLNDIFSLNRPSIFLTPNQVVIEGDERDKYWFDRQKSGYLAAWERLNDLCLEVVVPDEGQSEAEMCRMMMSELDRLTGLEASFETRPMNCWILKNRYGNGTGEKGKDQFTEMLKESSTGKLVYQLNMTPGNPIVWNEAEYAGDVDLNLEGLSDINQINRSLKKFGLILEEQPREVDLFVIKKE